MIFVDEESIKRLERENNRRQKWLEENIEVIPDPKKVTLYDFAVEWEQWSGTFMLKCDDKPCSREFYFQDNGASSFMVQVPMHISPLGMPASFAAVELSDKTMDAIVQALEVSFPKLTPHGLNRETGTEITVFTPLEDRLKPAEFAEAKLLVTPLYSISMDCS